MTDSGISESELQRIMQRVHEETAQRRQGLEPAPWRLPRMGGPPREWTEKDRYELRDFLAFHDVAFLKHAYRAILMREPDPKGSDTFLSSLRAGKVSRTNVVGRLRYSAEGRALGVPVDHLALPFALALLERVPVFGYMLSFASFLYRLPTLARSHQRAEGAVEALAAEVEASAARDQERLTFAILMLSDSLAAHARDKADRASLDRVAEGLSTLSHESDAAISRLQQEKATAVQVDAVHSLVTELGAAVRALDDGKVDRAAFDRIAEMVASLTYELDRGIVSKLRDTVTALGEAKADRSTVAATDETVNSLRSRFAAAERSGTLSAPLDDSFYAAFEAHFRGAADDIKRRVAEHLPTMVSAAAGTPDAPVLDIGCGRGEWLNVLKENGLVARGVDLNDVTVADCARAGLDVKRADALTHLQGLPGDALGAVTAFHVIEHLPFAQLIALLDESRRVLRPGGVVLLETPNPENLIVGACNFWLDPTHLKPLPPELMKFVCEARGFVRCEVQRLHPVPYDRHLSIGSEQVRHRLNEVLYGWQDYAIVAYKA